VTVQQKHLAGFSLDTSLLFVREESVQLWEALQAAVDGGMNISVGGPPGTGKSTETWAWALWTAFTKEIKVTWFHLSKRKGVKVVIDGATKKITTGHSAKISDIESSDSVILIVDGVTKESSIEISRACSAWRQKDEKHRRFGLVSSVSVTVALEQEKEAKIVNFTVGSWTFEQYEQACNEKIFYDTIKENLRCPGFADVDDVQKELLLSKYSFAGGCARWMFEFSFMEWKDDFNAHLNTVDDYKLLLKGGGGDANEIAVNHLRGATVLTVDGYQSKNYFFISQHAARELYNKCDDKRKFLIDSYKKANETQNPAFRGWIFEFDVDYQLEQACKDGTKFQVHIDDGDTAFAVSSYMEFACDADLVDPIKQLAVGGVLWAKPTLWCQKAFDFLCFWKEEGGLLNMVAANASHAKKHSVLLNVVNLLGTFLGNQDCVVEAIRFDFLVPTGTNVSVGNVEGRLVGFKNLAGIPWPNSPDAAAYLGSFIVVANVAPTQ
jgi:hypothetical protein